MRVARTLYFGLIWLGIAILFLFWLALVSFGLYLS